MQQILICSGIDGTLRPNGSAVESPDARRVLSQIAAHQKIHLDYVSRRNKDQVIPAIKVYNLPEPDFIIGDLEGLIHFFPETGNWLECAHNGLVRLQPTREGATCSGNISEIKNARKVRK
jgi:hypothetical protein